MMDLMLRFANGHPNVAGILFDIIGTLRFNVLPWVPPGNPNFNLDQFLANFDPQWGQFQRLNRRHEERLQDDEENFVAYNVRPMPEVVPDDQVIALPASRRIDIARRRLEENGGYYTVLPSDRLPISHIHTTGWHLPQRPPNVPALLPGDPGNPPQPHLYWRAGI
jgi:hypothetical protein